MIAMKRTALSRRTPLRPGDKPLGRKAPLRRGPVDQPVSIKRTVKLRPVDPKRAARKRERNFGPHAAWIKTLPCLVTGRYGVDPAHIEARGMGGCGGDKTKLVPLCRADHRRQEGRTEAYEAETGLDLYAASAILWAFGPHGAEMHERRYDLPAHRAERTAEALEECGVTVVERRDLGNGRVELTWTAPELEDEGPPLGPWYIALYKNPLETPKEVL